MATERDENDRIEFSVPPEPRHIGLARMFAAAVARLADYPTHRIDDLKIAVSESVSNSVKAHKATGNASPITIAATLGETLAFEITDDGGGLPASPTVIPDGDLQHGKLGLILLRALFDDAEVFSNGTGGTTVRLSLGTPLHQT